MNRVRTAIPAFMLLASLLLLLPRGLQAQEKSGSAQGKPEKPPVVKSEKEPSKTPTLSREDREVVQNLNLLEMMDLLKDMDTLAQTEDKK